jgi:hypothetical protein
VRSIENLRHYLYDNVGHGCGNKWDLRINVESAEEALDGLEQVYESIVTRANVLYRLIYSDVTRLQGYVHENSGIDIL